MADVYVLLEEPAKGGDVLGMYLEWNPAQQGWMTTPTLRWATRFFTEENAVKARDEIQPGWKGALKVVKVDPRFV